MDGPSSCYGPIDKYDDGVELSIRLLSAPEEWIPPAFIFLINNVSSRFIGSYNKTLMIREYPIVHIIGIEDGSGRTNVSI